MPEFSLFRSGAATAIQRRSHRADREARIAPAAQHTLSHGRAAGSHNSQR